GQLIQADGGTVIMTAQAVNALLDTVVNNSGLIQARGLSQQNGRILLDGGSSGVVANGATLDVSNAGGTGGSASILGDQVQLTAAARVDASGALGGGTVRVGGNAHGAGPERNATNTRVAAGARLAADATQSGNGGTVVVWADGSTVFDGAVSARGGSLAGNGGFVETSGKASLAVGDAATVNTLAPHGSAGNWLLDPKTITVGNTGTGTLTQAADVTNTTTALTIKASTLNGATSNVILAASQSITVNSAIAITTSGVGITFEGTNPTPTNGPSSGTTLTQNVGTTNGNVTFYGNVTLSTRSIGVTSGTANTTFNGTVNGGQNLTVTSTGTTTFGSTVGNSTPLTSLTLSGATGATALNGNVTTSGAQTYGGSLSVNAASTLKTTNSGITVTGAATLAPATVFNTGSGSLSLANTANNLGTLSITGAGAVTAVNAGALTVSGVTASGIVAISTQSGDLTVTGTTKTTNTSSSALTLEAGSSANRVATPGASDSNGNVVISGGSISVGSGGIGKIYSGSIANSTGLSTAVGTGHSRYWSDPGNTGYTTALTAGLNAIYREQPVVTVTASAAGSGRTYNGTTTAATFTTTGQVNGDTGSGTGTVSITGDGTSLLHAGSYTVGITGVSAGTTLAGLGYAAQAGAGSSYSIVPKNLTVSGLSVPASKPYDRNQTATVSGTPALLAAEGAGTGSATDGKPYSGDVIGITGTASGSYNSKDVATASSVTISGLSLTGNTYNDYALSPASFSATITPKTLTGSIGTGSSVYGAALDPGSVALSGVISGDTVTPATVAVNTSGLTSSSGHLTAGTHNSIESVSGTLSGTDSGNYSFAGATGNYTVSPLTITGSIGTGSSVYGAALDPGSVTLNGVISGDTVTPATVAVNTSGLTSSSGHLTAGTHNSIESVSGTLSGTDSGNYSFAGATGNYTVSPLTITGSIGTGSSVYGAALDPGSVTLNGVISGDTVTPATVAVNTSGLTSSSGHLKAGTHSSIESVSGTLSGSDSGNYSFAGATGNYTVTPLGITVTATGSDKTYNGSDAASVALSGSGVISGDTVSFTDTSATFADKNVGNNKTVNVAGIATSGTDSGNYSLNNTSATASANITPATLTATLTGTLTKTYDGNANVTTALTDDNYHITGFAPDEYAKINQTAATYNSKDVATASTVTASLSSANFVDGTGGFLVTNYTLPTSASGSGSITAKALTVSNTTVANKAYDGTTAATLSSGTLSGVVTGDTVTLNQAGSFASKNAGPAIAVTAADTLGGTDAGNYTLTQPTGLTANITPATLTAAIARFTTKTYDGTAAATLSDDSYSLSGLASGESIRISQTSGIYNSKDVASATTVTASLSSSDFVAIGTTLLSNYTLPTAASGRGSITAKALTVSNTTVANKVYDGSTAATLSGGTLSGVASGDTVTLTQAGNFAGKNVGTAIAVTAADTLGGANAGNYTLSAQPTGLSANITAKPITVTATGIDKTYDGTTTASVNLSSSGVVGGDNIGFTDTSANFSDKNVGTNKTVTVLGIAASGTDAGNYSLNNTSATTTASILQAALSVLSVTGTTVASKTYDGTNTATLSNGVLVGILNGDAVSLNQSGHFTSIHAGTNIPVVATDTLGGLDAGNYTLTQPTGLSGDILAKPLTITGTVVASKVYDSTTAATVSGGSLVGVIGSDAVTLSQSGAFASKNVGNGIAVTTTDTLGGANAGDYTLATQPAGLSGNITPAPLTVVLKGTLTKTYDGNANVTTALTDYNYKVTGFVGSEYTKINQTAATYNSPDVATATTVTASLSPSNFVNPSGGFLASNYTLPASASGLGTITPAPLTVTGTVVANKVYDGTAAATLSGGTLSGLVSGDPVTLNQSGTFASRNAGNGIAVTASDTLVGTA
ncbi:MAG: hypothetical protein KGI82_05325, partial [Betaproteobacteria bacterium]|nr:hypothetical protein [Betaproteobacteria bacterium]